MTFSTITTALRVHAPAIMKVAGGMAIGGSVAAAVIAGKKTFEEDGILEKHRAEKAVVDFKLGELENDPNATRKEKAEILSRYYIQSLSDYAKAYSPAISLAIGGAALMLGAGSIETKRVAKKLACTTAAYNALSASYDEYRKRVVEDCGEETDRLYFTGKKKALVEKEATSANGKTKTVKVEEEVPYDTTPDDNSKFRYLYDEINVRGFDRSHPYDHVMNLWNVQKLMTQRLEAGEVIVGNDILDALHMPRRAEACVLGWLPKSMGGKGYIDLGVFPRSTEFDCPLDDPAVTDKIAFLTGAEPAIWLTFNYDGLVYDKV